MRVRFVGREPALASFGQFLTDPVGVLELHGHPGVGKTRLLGEFARGARRAGYRVLRAGADPSLTAPPLYPMLCLAAQALGLPGLRPTREQLAQGMEKLGITDEHGPGLEALFVLPGAMALSSPETRVATIGHALAAAMESKQGRKRAFLMLDDIDDFDRPSLQVLKVLARRAGSGNRVRLVVSTRFRLLEQEWVQPLELDPLEDEAMTAMVSEAMGP